MIVNQVLAIMLTNFLLAKPASPSLGQQTRHSIMDRAHPQQDTPIARSPAAAARSDKHKCISNAQTAIVPSGTAGTVLLADRGDVALLKLDLARSGYTPVRCFGRASTAPVAIVLRDAVWLVATAVSCGAGVDVWHRAGRGTGRANAGVGSGHGRCWRVN
jgi:hypothetical protein